MKFEIRNSRFEFSSLPRHHPNRLFAQFVAIKSPQKRLTPLGCSALWQRSPHKGPGCGQHLQSHQKPLPLTPLHHRPEDHRVDFRRRILHGKTRVSISIRCNSADHFFRYSTSHPLAMRFPPSMSWKSESDSRALGVRISNLELRTFFQLPSAQIASNHPSMIEAK